MVTKFVSSAPARVCLYGEHQDYLELTVIPSAINLRLSIYSSEKTTGEILGASSFNQEKIKFKTSITHLSNKNLNLQSYLEAGTLAVKQHFKEVKIPALEFSIESQIPVASGLSSSAALPVSWINNLVGILDL